jgi:hypothetical protein
MLGIQRGRGTRERHVQHRNTNATILDEAGLSARQIAD